MIRLLPLPPYPTAVFCTPVAGHDPAFGDACDEPPVVLVLEDQHHDRHGVEKMVNGFCPRCWGGMAACANEAHLAAAIACHPER